MNKSIYSILFFLISIVLPIHAQRDTTVVRDTLQAAVKNDYRKHISSSGLTIISPLDFTDMVSVTGDGDVIKLIQTLPGISLGIEGSSAYFVRGGNLGGNRISIDGVPVYGSSHLLGFTSAYSPDIVENINFYIGGFSSEDYNFTDSHIAITSKTGSFDYWSGNASASNFLVGGSASGPIVKDRLSIIAALRVSPLKPEYELFSGILRRFYPDFEIFDAVVGDVYAKLAYRVSSNRTLSLSTFHSIDSYRLVFGSDNVLNWHNSIVNLDYTKQLPDGSSDLCVSYNYFANAQGRSAVLRDSRNTLSVNGSLMETSARWLEKRDLGKYLHIQFGCGTRMATFNPSASALLETSLADQSDSEPMNILLVNAHAQAQLSKEKVFKLTAAIKGTGYNCKGIKRKYASKLFPEYSMSASVYPFKWLTLEATADWTYSFYHLLEGIPMGWSADIMIPANEMRGPESARQFYAGILFSFGYGHGVSIGAYDKKSKDLVYFRNAVELFNPSRAHWGQNIIQGDGTSRGLELLYDKAGETLEWRLAYTLSKTDRLFYELNGKRPFPAKYDRTHILNMSAAMKLYDNEKCSVSAKTLFTLQSGHWETVPEGHYHVYPLEGAVFDKELNFYHPYPDNPLCYVWYSVPNGKWLGFPNEYEDGIEINYYSGEINNFRMPYYMRWDIGCSIHFKSDSYPSTLNVGFYNVLNRHNPFMIMYDADSGKWNQVSLLPIMPSLSYTIVF